MSYESRDAAQGRGYLNDSEKWWALGPASLVWQRCDAS
jgi:hypothetical protein